jgi:Fe-S cluster assembly iron-binding protein IscA
MLTLTENASTIVRDITAQIQPTEAADAGLRITTDATPEPAFAISATEGPQPGDAKVEQDGATVYLDGQSAEQLDDKVLDASLDPAGNVQFALGEQA